MSLLLHIGLLRFVYFLLRNKWNNKDVIKKITKTPVLFLSSAKVNSILVPKQCVMQDEMVPPDQMAKLCSLCPSPKVIFESLPNASHMNAFNELPIPYWNAIRDFIEECSNNKKSN